MMEVDTKEDGGGPYVNLNRLVAWAAGFAVQFLMPSKRIGRAG